MVLQQLGVVQSPWTIVKLDELSGSACEGSRTVKQKTEIETTHQQKAQNSPSNINNSTKLKERQHKVFMHPERHFQQLEMQDGQHLLQIAQFWAMQGLKVQKQQIFRQHLLHNSREILFVNLKWKRREKEHLSEIKPQAQIILLSPTRTGTKPSSADSQVRAPRRFQLIGVQIGTKKEIHTLKIFPRTPMEEILQPQPNTGIWGKTIRYLETWKLVKGVEFIQKGFFLLFKNEDSEMRLQEKLRTCPFSGSREEEMAYTEKLENELRECIIEQIHVAQTKSFNPTFIIPKPHQKWRKILDVSALNKAIQTIRFKMNRTDLVRDLVRKGDWATSLDIKSAFHHLIVYQPHRPYLAFVAMGKVYQYRAMPFGTQHSPIFFAQALAMVLTKIRRESDIRILNCVDDLLLFHQNKEKLRKQILIIMEILEPFGWTIAQEKCEIEPKQQINFLKWTWDLERMYIKMTDLRKQELRYQLRRVISLTERQVSIKIKHLVSIIGKLNFLRVQVREASLYLKLMDSAKIRALKNKEWKENMILPKEILQELYWWQGMIASNKEMTLEVRIPEAVMVSDASPKGWRENPELQTRDTLVQHGELSKVQKRWISNKKEMEAIFLGLFRYRQVFKELQMKAIPIRKDSSTADQDFAKQKAGQTPVADVKQIVKLCQQLRIQIQIQHIPGISNKITDTLSKLSTQGDYSLKKEIFIDLCQAWEIIPTLDLFATAENKLVDRFVAIGEEEEGAEWFNAYSRPWKEEIFWIHSPIPMIGKALIAQEKFKQKSIMIEPWWPGQIWFMSLLTDSSRYLILGEISLILNPGKDMMKKKDMLSPGYIAALFMDQESIKEENYQQSFQTIQIQVKNLKKQQQKDRNSTFRRNTCRQWEYLMIGGKKRAMQSRTQ
ncbi:MAG: putative Transposon Ty3-I Gag-Pol polyprotein [Streblomastix strix]|uniref:Putative Transposon Ty3-I Gag-Pol polyprotein n=1 Tax=Streblomastix strix TaxID=222440 RepID=A0A5J4VE14_9EUKA|nr:MAG: putative Transposon Ty3-I Gag-Pol polyprotein [Streblomastix strix]